MATVARGPPGLGHEPSRVSKDKPTAQSGEGDGGGHGAGGGLAPKMHQAGEGDRAREDAGPASKAPAREGSGGPILATAGQEMGRRTEEASCDQGGWCAGFQNMNTLHVREKVTTALTPPLQMPRRQPSASSPSARAGLPVPPQITRLNPSLTSYRYSVTMSLEMP